MEINAIFGQVLTILMLFGTALFAGAISFISFFMFKEYQKKREFKCLILKSDGFGKITSSWDYAGIYTDKKTNNKRFYLTKSRVGLPPDNIPFINVGKDKLVILYQNGLKNFRFVLPSINNLQQVKFTVSEEDVNWAINAYESAKKNFYNSKWAEYAPMIMFVISVIAIVFMIIFVLKKFDAIAEAAAIFKDATKNLAVAKASVI